MIKQKSTFFRFLTGYYGLLQSLHLLILIRAGILLLSTADNSPFPILPPPGGWEEQTLPFMFGLGGTDMVGILLGVGFAYLVLFKGIFIRRLGILSLTIFITGAIVFGAGIYPSGAWTAHPIAYWTMAVLFIPAVILYILLLRNTPSQQSTHELE